MKYCSILGPPRPSLEKGAGTRLPAAFSRKLGPVLERQLTANLRTPLPPAGVAKKLENQRKSKLRSGGLFLPFTDRSKRPRTDLGADMSSKWGQNGVQKGSRKGPPTGCSIQNSFLNPFSLIFEVFFKGFFDAVLDCRITLMNNVNVQNHPIFSS